jgi:ABC-type multidrug transport system fused ATPase/permease subunit
VINALGRDLLSLIGLVAVMVWKAPFMAILAFMVMPPAVLTVRKLMKRVRAITLTQFDGGADILKTTQETIQGFRIIKAFNLEAVVRAQVYESIASVERASNKLARVANRSTPLMEALGGFAIAGVFIYGGYRVLVLNLPPGELFSFITAFLLAYEPAKRIARLNIELHNALTGVQVLFDVLDVPDRKPARPKPDIKVTRGAIPMAAAMLDQQPAKQSRGAARVGKQLAPETCEHRHRFDQSGAPAPSGLTAVAERRGVVHVERASVSQTGCRRASHWSIYAMGAMQNRALSHAAVARAAVEFFLAVNMRSRPGRAGVLRLMYRSADSPGLPDDAPELG